MSSRDVGRPACLWWTPHPKPPIRDSWLEGYDNQHRVRRLLTRVRRLRARRSHTPKKIGRLTENESPGVVPRVVEGYP